MTLPPPNNFFHFNTLDVPFIGYLFLCLNIFFFSALMVTDPVSYHALAQEDRWMENLTAVWFFLAGLLLFATAVAEPSVFRRCAYVLGGLAMLFVAGEEIS